VAPFLLGLEWGEDVSMPGEEEEEWEEGEEGEEKEKKQQDERVGWTLMKKMIDLR